MHRFIDSCPRAMSTVRNAWSAADESRSRRDPSGPWSKEAGPQRCTKQWSSWFADFYTIPFGRNLHACSLYTVRVFEMYVNSQVCMYMDVCIHRHTFIFPSLSSYDIHVDIFSNCTSCPQAMSYKHQLPCILWPLGSRDKSHPYCALQPL